MFAVNPTLLRVTVLVKRILESTLHGMNYDFCPGLNRYVYWLRQPIGWVVCGAGFSALVGLFVGHQGFVLMWAFLALLVLGVVWPWLSMKGLSCQLRFQQSRTQEGRHCTVILEIVNRFPVPAFGLMLEGNFLQSIESEHDKVAVGLRRVPAWSVSRFQWQITPEQRGQLPTDVPQLCSGFPFGISNVTKPVKVEGSTIVWPAMEELEDSAELGGLQFNIDGLHSERTGNDGETLGVRHYRHGDPIKNIHWTHTARCGRLIVRERQTISQMPIRVIVDLTAENHTGDRYRNTYEDSIRMTSSVCHKLHVQQARIELICLGLPNGIQSRSCNRKGLRGLLDFLALLPTLDLVNSELDSVSLVQPVIRADDHIVILIHTAAFQGSVKSNKLLHRICVGEQAESHSRENSFRPRSNRLVTGSVTPAPFDVDPQAWQGDVRAVG